MPTTEILIAPLQAGSEIGNPDNAAGKVIAELGQTLSKQDGLQQIYFGMQVETATNFQMLVDWDSLDHHKNFTATATYGPFLQRFLSITTDRPSIVHADFKPEGALARALSAPVTEVATFFFEGQPPEGYIDRVLKLGKILDDADVEGYKGAAAGITHEEVEHEGVKGTAAVVAIGWTSVEDHLKFRETQSFKDNIHLLREGSKGAEVHHVQFLNYVA